MATALTDWPADELTTETVSVFTYAGGQVLVVADQAPDHADWMTAIDYLGTLGFGPYSLTEWDCEREHDVWSLRLPAAA
jgi:hypothetical protein